MTLHQRFDLIAGAPRDRRAALVAQLHNAGCAVRFDESHGGLELILEAAASAPPVAVAV